MPDIVLQPNPSDPGYLGLYVSEAALDVRLNSLNLTVELDLDADGNRDPGAAQQVIENAEGRVNLYTGGPFAFTGGSARDQAAARAAFARWALELAVDEAVAKRVPVTSDAGQAMERRVALVIREMEMFRESRAKPYLPGRPMLPGAVPDHSDPTTPAVVAGQAGQVPTAGGVNLATRQPDPDSVMERQRRAAPSCGW